MPTLIIAKRTAKKNQLSLDSAQDNIMNKETIFTFVLKVNTENFRNIPGEYYDQEATLDGLGETMKQSLVSTAEEALDGHFASQRIECTYDVIEMAHGPSTVVENEVVEELRTTTSNSVQRVSSVANGDSALSIFRETGQHIVLKNQIEGAQLALVQNDQQNQDLLNQIDAANADANELAAQLDGQ